MLLHQVFEDSALRHPDRVAVKYQETSISYGELNSSANQLAEYIKNIQGVKSGVIALGLEKGPLMVTAVLAVLKVGMAWVPLQLDAPRARIKKILETSNAGLILTSQTTCHIADGLSTVVVLDDIETREQIQQQSAGNLFTVDDGIHPTDLCHILFTSGSTGLPKGVMLEHQAVVHNVRLLADLFCLDEHTRTLQFAAYTFDVFGLDMFMTFAAGGCLVMGTLAEMMSDMTSFINRARINYAQLTPTIISLVDPNKVPTLRVLASSGEPLTAELLHKWAGRVRLFNAYGPTETIVCTVQEMSTTLSREPQFIGSALPGLDVTLMAEDSQQEVPAGTPGEICVAGVQLFRDYLGVDGGRSGHFISRGSQRFYRTGDLGVLVQLPDSAHTIRLLGRRDRQVKVHGVRVDLGDVEKALGSYALTQQSIALVPKSGPAQNRLAAVLSLSYYNEVWEQVATGVAKMNLLQPTEPTQQEVLKGLIDSVRSLLPPQAVPSTWWILDKLPLTASGKLNHQLVQEWLEAMTEEQYARFTSHWRANGDGPSPPGSDSPLVRRLINLCSRALGLGSAAVDPQAPLLQVGFDSLAIFRLVSMARQEGMDVNVQQVLRDCSIAQLGVLLSRAPSDLKPLGKPDSQPFSLAPAGVNLRELRHSVAEQCHVDPEDIVDIYPCTPLQSGMMALAARRSDSYICDMSFLLSPAVDKDRFRNAWELLLSGIPLLRSRIVHDSDGVGLFQAVVRHRATTWSREAFNAPMSWGDTLCRGKISWDEPTQRWKFALKMHHSLFDGWTKDLILLELKKTYESNKQLDYAVTPFRDFIAYLARNISDQEASHASFWQGHLDGCAITDFPATSLEWTGDLASHHDLLTHQINADVSAMARKYQVTATTVVQTAWAIVLGKYTGADDVVFGSTLSGRDVPVEDIDCIIGPTMVTVPCRARWDSSVTLGQFLQRFHQESIEMIPHQQFGLQNIANIGQDARNGCSFRSLLVVQPENTTADILSGFIQEEEHSSSDMLRTYPVTIEFGLSASVVATVRVHYDRTVISEEMLCRVLDHLESILRQISSVHPETLIGDLEMLGETKMEQVLASQGGFLEELVRRKTVEPPQHSPPQTKQELRVYDIWQEVLGAERDFSLADNFFRVGGNSLLSIRLVLACRKRGLQISVAQIYENPTLGEMAAAMIEESSQRLLSQPKAPAPFSLIKGDARSLLDEVAEICDIDAKDIEDVYPASPFQEGLAAININAKAAYMARWVFRLPDETDLERLQGAMEVVVARNPILRTTLAYASQGTVQAVMTMAEWKRQKPGPREVQSNLHVEGNKRLFGYSISPSRGDQDKIHLQIRIHHILYDEWTIHFVLDDLAYNYCHPDTERPGRPTYANFIHHLANLAGNDKASADFWRRDLEHAQVPEFPRAPSSGRPFRTDMAVQSSNPMSLERERSRPEDPVITPAAITAAALAIFLSSYGNTEDVTFGLTLSGRHVAGLEEVAGPTICTVPLRIRLNGRQDTEAFLGDVQSKMRVLQDFQHVGLHRIAKLGGEGPRRACDFRTLLVVQQGTKSRASSTGNIPLQLTAVEEETFMSLNYGVVVILMVDGSSGRVKLKIEYDSDCLTKQQAHQVLYRLTRISGQLSSTQGKVDTINVSGVQHVGNDENQVNHSHSDSIHSLNREAEEKAEDTQQSSLLRQLRILWAKVLDIPIESIGADDHIKRLGGDSITLIRLVSAARKSGFRLSIGDNINQFTTLADMSTALESAQRIQRADGQAIKIADEASPLPFSLVEGMSKEACIRDAATKCSVDATSILDVYPCTSIQEGLMALSSTNPGSYLAQNCYKILGDVDGGRLERALRRVWQAEPILRTRIFINAKLMTVQAVLDDCFLPFGTYRHYSSLGQYLAMDGRAPFTYGRPLTRFALVFDAHAQAYYLVVSQHHAISDGWTTSLLIDAIKQEYFEGSELDRCSAKNRIPSFIKFVKDVQKSTAAARFWDKALDGVHVTDFPPLGRDGTFRATEWSITSCEIPSSRRVPLPTVLEAAWGLVLGKYDASEDVCFGVVRSGRTVPIPDIEVMMAPTIATIPRRLNPQAALSVDKYLDQVFSIANKCTPFEHFGLSNIGLLGRSARSACNFRTLLIVQPKVRPSVQDAPGQLSLETVDDESMFGTYGLIVDCQPHENGSLSIHINFDKTSISADEATWISNHFVSAISQLGNETSTLLSDIDIFGEQGSGPIISLISRRESTQSRLPRALNGTTTGDCIEPSSDDATATGDGPVSGVNQDGSLEENSECSSQSILRQLWADVLQIDPQTIELEDDFGILGGDSISAIKLSSLAREKGITLPPRSVLQSPILKDMAVRMKGQQVPSLQGEPGVSKKDNKQGLVAQICEMYDIVADAIEDVYPCTPLQTSLMALTLHKPQAYVATETFRLSASTDIERFTKAWDSVYQRHHILRTRIYQVFDDDGRATLVQAVCARDTAPWRIVTCDVPPEEQKQQQHQQLPGADVGLGTPLCRFSLLRSSEGDHYYLQLMRHHSIYDGWSAKMLWDDLERAYVDGHGLPSRPPFRSYVQYLQSLDRGSAMDFWRKELDGYRAEHYPSLLPGRSSAETSSLSVELTVAMDGGDTNALKTFGFSNLVKAAWALTTAAVGRWPSETHDICFGTIVSGRMDPVVGIEDIAGPTLCTVPVRITVDVGELVDRYLQRVSGNAMDMMGFEYVGLNSIGSTSECARAACQFRDLLVVQPPQPESEKSVDGIDGILEAVESGKMSQPYGIVMECKQLAGGRGLHLSANFDEVLLPEPEVRVVVRHFSRIIKLLSDPSRRRTPISDILRDLTTVEDYQAMVSFNDPALPPSTLCLHDLVERSARTSPHRTAVLAHDQELSYGALERTSGRLATYLRQNLGFGPGTSVPICFEKSSLMIIAVLAIMKAGAAYVPLDPTHPPSRLRYMIDQCTSSLVLVSAAQQSRVANAIGAQTLVVDSSLLESCDTDACISEAPPAPIGSENVAYVIYTSGSTGRPKGVVMTHGSISLSMMQYGRVFGFPSREKGFRTLQFSSYTFDVSVVEIFGTLAFGGTICVPTDEDRLNDLANVMVTMEVDTAFLTPTIASTIQPDEVPLLELLCTSGEPLTPSLAQLWTQTTRTRLFNAYGPTETAVHCSARKMQRGVTPKNIGSPFGGQLWITDLEDHTRLRPVGCIGEVIVSGGTLANGYLGNAEETAKAFIDDVSWFEGAESRRIYKTGDVARFKGDGSLEILGRKNSRQVKLHGLRIELGEIEAALRSCNGDGAFVNAVVEKIHIGASDSLVAFFQTQNSSTSGSELQDIITPLSWFSKGLKSLIRVTLESLQNLLPAYMIPSLFLPISRWPYTTSGKTDHQLLRLTASELSATSVYMYRDIDEINPGGSTVVVNGGPGRTHDVGRQKRKTRPYVNGYHKVPRSRADIQDLVVNLWRRTLRLDASVRPRLDQDFFSAGGDSVSSIFLVAEFRREGIQVTVSDLYQQKTITGLVDLILSRQRQSPAVDSRLTDEAFSLVPVKGAQLQSLLSEAAAELDVSTESIEDMYPCIPLQEGTMFLSERVEGSYHARLRLLMPHRLNIERLYLAFRRLVEMHDILRTRIIFHSTLGSMQVVLCPAAHFHEEEKLQLNGGDDQIRFGYRLPLHRHALVAEGDRIFLELECHHSMYDGWSLPLLVQDLRRLYQDGEAWPDCTPTPFRDMVAYAQAPAVEKAAEEFWNRYLRGAIISDFPEIAGRAHDSIRATSYHRHTVSLDPSRISRNTTMATILTAAWSLVVSRYTSSNDVCFGLLVSGRNAPVSGIETIRGPTITTVPFRVALEHQGTTIASMLDRVQSHMVDMIPHQFRSLTKLRKAFSQGHGDFGSLLSIQSGMMAEHSDDPTGDALDFTIHSTSIDGKQAVAIFGEPYPLFLDASVGKTGDVIILGAQYDPEIVSADQVNRILQQYEVVIRQLANPELGNTFLADVSLLSESDIECLLDWAGKPIEREKVCVHEMIEEIAAAHPDHQAIECLDESVTYKELEERANSLASHLLRIAKDRIHRGMTIPVWMETSPTAVVALLAILKLGASYVPLDHRFPVARAEYIVRDVAADIILVSGDKSNAAGELVARLKSQNRDLTVVQVDYAMTTMEISERSRSQIIPPDLAAHSSDLAYVIYTSGSTGKPKGVMVEHWALTATVKEQAITYGFGLGTRMFGLASLSWDPSLLEIFATLSHGGCLCIPTEDERSGCQDLIDSINRHRAEQISTSPAVASLIDLRATPTVKAISLGGEVLRKENILNAHEAGVRLFNIYGPSEACIDAIVHRNVVPGVSTQNIGRPMSSQVWIVDPANPRNLVPPGCAGELALSGTLARGYLNDDAKTARSFLSGCSFASPVYLTGDLARYEADGSIYFLGRKDRQVKLNGQRVELGDIENAVKTLCPQNDVVVDYFSVSGDAKKLLVVFLSNTSTSSSTREEGSRSSRPIQVESRMRPDSDRFQNLQTQLRSTLPRYMVPRIFINVSRLPLSNADKVDINLLRAAYAQWLDESSPTDQEAKPEKEKRTTMPITPPPSSPPLSHSEVILRRLWASAIGCREESIQAQDDIFDLGADSLTVIKLATSARKEGLSISVAEVYASPTLSRMAKLLHPEARHDASSLDAEPKFPPPFSLLPDPVREVLQNDVERANTRSKVVDMFPCTSFQATAVIQGQKRHKAFYAWFILQIKGDVDEKRLEAACDLVLQRHAALRTSYHVVDGNFLQQVHPPAGAVSDFRSLGSCRSVEAFIALLDRDVPEPVTLERILTRFRTASYSSNEGRDHLLAIGMSHAQYDGFCWMVILNDLYHAYLGQLTHNAARRQPPPFSAFISHSLKVSRDPTTGSFWSELLRESKMTSFATRTEQLQPRRVLDSKQACLLPRYHSRPGNATFAIVVKAAWSIVLSWLSGTSDVVFGSLVFGRNPQVDGIGEMVGACINMVPNRVSFSQRRHLTVADLLESIQQQQVSIVPFETTSLPDICRYANWSPGTRFGSIVQHQNIDEGVFAPGISPDPSGASNASWSFEGSAVYPGLCDDVVDCWITTDPRAERTELHFQYSSAVIPDDCAAEITRLLCDVIRAIYADLTRPVDSLRALQDVVPSIQSRISRAGLDHHRSTVNGHQQDQQSQEDLPDGQEGSVLSLLSDLWAKVLPPKAQPEEKEANGDTSFFDLGGDSARALQLVAICRKEGLSLRIQDVFEYPTRRLQAACLHGEFDSRRETEDGVHLILQAK